MAKNSERTSDQGQPPVTYNRGYGPNFLQQQDRRSAGVQAGFLLPHLRPGMRLLDCGCGPGAITVGLAGTVAPGEVVGIDKNARVIEAARALAVASGVTNCRFQVEDIYDLPFPDSSFDAAFAHAVLLSLEEPVRALQEVRRILKPGGVVAISDGEQEGNLMEPMTPLLAQWKALRWSLVGSRSAHARYHRRLLLEAGYVRSEGSARVYSFGTLEATRRLAALQVEMMLAWSAGAIDATEREAMAAELRAWGERPDAFYVITNCEAVGWVPDVK